MIPPVAATSGVQPDATAAEHEVAVASFAAAFKRATGAVRRLRGRDTHRSDELSYAQFGLLFGLAENGEMSASELAGCADVAPGTATQMLDHLDAAGLIARTRSGEDRRIVLVSLTQRGSEVIAARQAQYDAHWRAGFAGFSAAELQSAAAVLEATRTLFDELERDAEHSAA
ncbi:MAG: MarR family transcriptional regulator [Solirubrobacteraceae bacterium]